MYAFGMLGNYFSQGVYAVAGPFQGAVDIIVVQQEDGTFKSSPWYVKCGDFQGVLTRREKIVDISVNGNPADFYMLLNNRGEAYFEKEVDDAVLALPSTSSSTVEDMEENGKFNKFDSSIRGTEKEDSQVERLLPTSTQGNTIDHISALHDDLCLQDHPELMEPPSLTGQSSGSLLDQPVGLQRENDLGNALKKSPGPLLDQPVGLQRENDVGDASKNAACGRDSSGLTGTNQLDPHLSTTESRSEQWKPSDFDAEVRPIVINVNGENLILAEADSIFSQQEPIEERQQLGWPSDVDSGVQISQDGDQPHPLDEVSNASASTSGMDDAMLCQLNTVITEDWFSLQEASGFESGDHSTSFRSDLEASDAKVMDEPIWNDYKIVTAEEERELHDALKTDSVLGVRIDGQSVNPAIPAAKSSGPPDSSVWVSDALVDDATSSAAIAVMEDRILTQNNNGEASADGATLEDDVVYRVDERPPTGSKTAEIPTITVVPPPSRWTMWPLSLRRSRGEKAPVSEAAAKKQALLAAANIAVGSPLTEEILRKNGYYEWTQKPKLRSYVPTSAQIESLKLKDGPNNVTFTFPRVLGRTQVDANIYLWKWKTRIVISDVDGTITKSDVLGQFMPLVGRDWSQSGVTRLFSAIKENGYEVLFLSARAISQAYLTRQFLINLKQDGETLPEGPVFISPDGLIPSLYREVVRRAPHEFKISCLEGIRRLFPNDINPFYAGFGNRDTDEISYLKVGIPKGKIFIINPKGEVMVNHHVDVKSYTSIHALVDDMFPPVYSYEQEDFNSWNYWKLPLPDVVDELSSSAKSTKVKKGATSKK